jgi:ABC-type uncharacterized transport system substrate-binding protein
VPGGLRFLIAGLCLLLIGVPAAWARGETIWLVLSSGDAAVLEAAEAIRRKLADSEIETGPWQDFVANKGGSPRVIVTVGTEALNRIVAQEGVAWSRAPVVAALVSRSALKKAATTYARPLTGVYLDQPLVRQMALLRLAAPESTRIGVLLGPDSRRYQGEVGRAIRDRGLADTIALVEDLDQLPRGLQTVLSESDVFLAIPDSEIMNNRTAQNILMAAYRRRVPVLGYSAAFVRAGALMAVHSTPEQIGRQAAGLVAEILAGRAPAAQEPREFNVAINGNVAHAFGLDLDEGRLTQQLRREQGAP